MTYRFRGRVRETYFICWLIINKPQPNLHSGTRHFYSGTLILVPRVSPEEMFHAIIKTLSP